MREYCGPQQPDCTTVMARIDGARVIREPSGKALTCSDITGATSAAAMRALGIACGQ